MKNEFIKISSDNDSYNPNIRYYPSGELGIELKDKEVPVRIDASIQNSEQLIVVCGAIRTLKNLSSVHISYLPYQRQEKEKSLSNGNFEVVLSNEVIQLIKSAIGDRDIKVFTYDNHTEIKERNFYQLKPNVSSIASSAFTTLSKKGLTDNREFTDYISNLVIVYPDKGALTRYGKGCGYKTIYFNKSRNEKGEIVSQSVDGDLQDLNTISGRDILVIDDISDGGATFINLGKVIKKNKPQSMSLYVSNALLSKGSDGVNEMLSIYDSFICNWKVKENDPEDKVSIVDIYWEHFSSSD